MRKEEVYDAFWNSFDVPAYDENTVPDDAVLPRITYEMRTDHFGSTTMLTASIWARSNSWGIVTDIKDKIATRLSQGGQTLPYEGGMMWIKRGTPFSQRMSDTDDSIRRIIINVEVEYISEV